MYEEYKELVRLLKGKAERFDYDGWVDTAVVMEKAADAIEKMNQRIDFLMNCIYEAEDALDRGTDNEWASLSAYR